MATEPIASQPDGAALTPPNQLVVNLQVVSPSVGVNRPLLFPDLPAATTIKGLKDRIRLALPLRPADENQRLIHRGRALLRESDSLLDVFGADATIHLVIRDTADMQTSSTTAPRGPSPVDAGRSGSTSRRSQSPHVGAELPSGLPRRPVQHPTLPTPQSRMPSPAPAPFPPHYTPEQAAAFQQQHQSMTNWLTQIQQNAHLQREAMVRALVNQNQRGRAQMGMRGIGDQGASSVGAGGQESGSGRASPNLPSAAQHEAAPNGQPYHVEHIIRVAAQGTAAGLPPTDLLNILRGADATQATNTLTNAMHRSASGTSLHNRPLSQPGVTTPVFGNGTGLTGSGRVTPDPDSRWAEAARVWASASGSANPQASPGSQVYIVMSPEGPRAVLFNPSASETYYTPRLRPQASWPFLPVTRGPPPPNVTYGGQQAAFATPQTQEQRQHARPEHPPAANLQQPMQPMQPVHPGNPPAAGLPPLLLHLWPHLWLIFRLGLFVWFFTSPDASWSRWLTVICMAVFAFVLSTGLLNGVAESVWRPIGRHIENILPTLDHPQGAQAIQRGQDRELNPEQMAARLVAERRGREGWLTGQVRRLERAGLLFLASIAPGVAERHIANLEAEARAEQTRQGEAEAAAAAAAANTSDGQGDAAAIGEHDTNTHESEGSREGAQQQGGSDDHPAPQREQDGGGGGEDLIAL
ncbi:Ubiquitin family protein [Purpureocillium lavendulum]|uniref:Ubiquitin family protein n=1 Tax=Purpureocillium lavendulum TaxID=1247861 RepID=A0AB34FXP0_9HYPO|nr:Ubiquitin family protein [Purpureocillium lavendulum]